jgi:diguanylate cyclase (GGDEF)-like protein
MPLDRLSGATIARTGGRLVAALLPLAAIVLIRAFPALHGSTPPWTAWAIPATAAVVAGLALLVAVDAALEEGRIRTLADLAGLGLIATAFAVLILDADRVLGLGIGMTFSGAAFLVGSVVRGRAAATRLGRVIGLVIAFALVEAGLAAILVAAGWSIPERTGPILLAGGALLMVVAAAGSLDNPVRATALAIAASSAGAMAIASTSGTETLVGPSGMALAALALGWRLLLDRPRRARLAEPAAPVPELTTTTPRDTEFDELSRLAGELRATLDDLVAARHLIELQRIEIDRASSTDTLTGIPGRGPTLARLRTEAAEARRYAHPVAVVLLDIDQFAALNHEHGLDVGDEMLRRIALRLRVRMREADAVGRIGADAFLAILPHTDEMGASTFARAVLDRVLERRVMTERGEIAVGLSIGIALMRPGMTLSGDELLAAAEEALASARAAGGNRIAFDRLHGLARLDERGPSLGASVGDLAEGNA